MRPARRSLLATTLALLVAVVVCLIAPSQALSFNASTCSLPIHTLSFACDGACGNAYTPCFKTTNRSTSTQSFAGSRCGYECFRIVNGSLTTSQSYSKFVFLVPFGEWKSPQERAGLVPRASAYANDTDVFPSASNDLLRNVAKLQLPKETTYMYVCVCDELRLISLARLILN